MFKRKKKKTGCETPKFRRHTAPPQYKAPPMPPVNPPKPPTSGSNAVKPKKPCVYETPCGWCAKWDKKCDRKIGHKKDKDLEDIKSGKGLTSACVFREPWKSIVP